MIDRQHHRLVCPGKVLGSAALGARAQINQKGQETLRALNTLPLARRACALNVCPVDRPQATHRAELARIPLLSDIVEGKPAPPPSLFAQERLEALPEGLEGLPFDDGGAHG